MSEHRVAHLVVLGAASGRPVGILSALDVVAVLGSRASD
jgi:CBS domain-containing protein